MASRIHQDRARPRLSTLQLADGIVLVPHKSKCMVGYPKVKRGDCTKPPHRDLRCCIAHQAGTLSQCSDFSTCSHDISKHYTPAQRSRPTLARKDKAVIIHPYVSLLWGTQHWMEWAGKCMHPKIPHPHFASSLEQQRAT